MSDFIANLQENLAYAGVLMPTLLTGAWYTVKLFVVTLILSIPLGLPFALGGNCRFRLLRFLCKTYIWIFRGTPLLLQLFFFLTVIFCHDDTPLTSVLLLL